MAAKIQQRNELVNRQCAELAESLKLRGYRSCVLKGQGVAALYKFRDENLELIDLSALRQSGDIDVYVDCGRAKAIEFARSIQDEVDWDYKHLHLDIFTDTEVELHYVPEVLLNLRKNKKLQKWFKDHQDMIFTKQGELVSPSVEFNACYILLHIYRHFLYEGVGLRQLIDYYFVLRAANKEGFKVSGGQEFQELLRTFGMMRFVRGVMWIIAHVFANVNANVTLTFSLGLSRMRRRVNTSSTR